MNDHIEVSAAADVRAGAESSASRGQSQRFPGFDRLRAFCMFFIAYFHAALPYADARIPAWVKDPGASPVFTILTWASAGFTLRIFFVMAGFFARMLYCRYGIETFLRHRLLRIGVPFVLGTALCSYAIAALTGYRYELNPYHLWFLEYLLLISIALPIGVSVAARLTTAATASVLDRAFCKLVASAWSPVVLAIPTSFLVHAQGDEASADPSIIITPDGFVPVPITLVYYALFFGFGWLLHRNTKVLDRIAANCAVLLVGALALRALTVPLVLLRSGQIDAPAWLNASFLGWATERWSFFGGLSLLGALFTWTSVLGFVGLFHRMFRVDRKLGRYLSDASYWFYLVHVLPLIVFVQGLTQTGLPVTLKYLLVCGGITAVSLVTYHYLVRYSLIGWVLNGARARPEDGRPSSKHASERKSARSTSS